MTVNHGVLGSSPCSGADARGLRKGSFKKRLQGVVRKRVVRRVIGRLPLQSQAIHYGSLAQLVQSVCLTSRGSGVRIPQLPPSSANGATWKIENRVSARYTVFSFYPCTDGNKRKLLNSRRNTLERVFSAPTQSPRHSGRSIRRHLKQTAPVLTQINLAQPPAYTIFAKIFRCKSASFSGKKNNDRIFHT